MNNIFPLQQASPDTLQIANDSLIADSASVVDTSNVITQFSREVGEAGRLLVTGEWELVINQLYQGLANLVVDFIPKAISALFVFLFFYIAYRVFGSVLGNVLGRSKRIDASLGNLILKTYRVVVLTFIAIMVLAQFDIDVTALLAGLSIIGIAVGFAARDTIENFISGVTILLDKPFRVGDNIEVDSVYGTVEESTLRSTRLRTLNNQIMVMPNITMINQRLVNHSMLGVVRVEVPFGIAYKEFPQQAREVVLRLTEGDGRLHPDYPPDVVVTSLNDSSVDMTLRIWVRTPKLEVPIRYEYIEKVREALRKADIEIPFPHLQLFVDEAKALEESFLMQPQLHVANPRKPSA